MHSNKLVIRCMATFGTAGFVLSDGSGTTPFDPEVGAILAAGGVMMARLVYGAFVVLDDDVGQTDQVRRVKRMSVEDLAQELDDEAALRATLNHTLPKRVSPRLEDRPFVGAVMGAALKAIEALPVDVHVKLLLVRGTRDGFKVVETRGMVEEDLMKGVEWTRSEIMTGGAFVRILAPLDYVPLPAHFWVGRTEYMLLAVSSTELPHPAVLTVSRAATRLMRALCDEVHIYAAGGKR